MPRVCQNLYYNLTKEQDEIHEELLASKADLDLNLQTVITLQ